MLVTMLGLHGQTTGKGTAPKDLAGRRPVEVFMCSVKNKIGYGDGEQGREKGEEGEREIEKREKGEIVGETGKNKREERNYWKDAVEWWLILWCL